MINARCLGKSLKQDKHVVMLPQNSLPDSGLWLQLDARSLYLIRNRFVFHEFVQLALNPCNLSASI